MAKWPHGKEERGLAQNGSSVEQHAERAKRKVSPWMGVAEAMQPAHTSLWLRTDTAMNSKAGSGPSA